MKMIGKPNLERSVSTKTGRSVLDPAMMTCEEAKKSITFGDPQLLRASASSAILSNGGRILDPRFDTSNGAGDLYQMSARRDHIDAFVSHNWSTPRIPKLFTLALHFNLTTAFALTAGVAVVVMLLQIAGNLPAYQSYKLGEVQEEEVELTVRAPWCKIAGTATFFAGMLLSHEVRSRVGCCPGPTFFMDKTCIHQTDLELKKQGIQSLGAFLNYSWSMVVVYSDCYLQKLWTVYEVASFLALHPGGAMNVLPIFMWKVVAVGNLAYFGFLLWYFFCLLVDVRRPIDEAAGSGLGQLISYIGLVMLLGPSAIAFSFIMRRWAHVQAQLREQVAQFCVQDARCFCEDDRPVVYSLITAFIRAMNVLDEEAVANPDQEVLLEEFNKLVRTEVPDMILVSIGRIGIPYKHVAAMCLGHALHTCDNFAVFWREGWELNAIISNTFLHGSLFLGVFPLYVALTSLLTSRMIHIKRRCFEVLYVLVTSSFECTVTAGTYFSLRRVEKAGRETWGGAALYACVLVAILGATAWLYRPYPYTKHKRRLRADERPPPGAPPPPSVPEEDAPKPPSTPAQGARVAAESDAAFLREDSADSEDFARLSGA